MIWIAWGLVVVFGFTSLWLYQQLKETKEGLRAVTDELERVRKERQE